MGLTNLQEIRAMEPVSAQCVASRMPKQVVMYTQVGIYNGANSSRDIEGIPKV